ncbi:YesL family protein [Pseudactinotalea sp.]|uniref:YesL family protein n=1 Tax=Pseudactinotalea sp. TaxID=1926260 RepID=UPI003B3AC97E
MSRFFSADSALMRALDRLADVIILNLVFIATSLPLLTLGASLTALHSVSRALVGGRLEDSVARAYLRAFRANLRDGSRLLAAIAGLVAVLVAWFGVIEYLVVDPLAQLLMFAVWFVLAIQVTTTAIVAFPYLATFDDATARVLRNALLMSWRHPLAALCAFTVTALPVVITVFYPKVTGYGVVWLVAGFAAIAVVTTLLFTRIFAQYTPAAAAAPSTEEPVRAHS